MAAGKLQASTFTYPPPSREAKILHESRNTPHSSKVSQSISSLGGGAPRGASSPNTISLPDSCFRRNSLRGRSRDP